MRAIVAITLLAACCGGGLPIEGPCCDSVYSATDPTIVCGEHAVRHFILIDNEIVGALCVCPDRPDDPNILLLPRCSPPHGDVNQSDNQP